MNVQLTFDKLAYVDRLKAAGIDERHARAHAEGLDQALREEVATKSDITGVKHEIEALRAELKTDFAEIRAETKADIADVRAEMKAGFDEVKHEFAAERLSSKADMAVQEATLLRWFIGTAITLVALTATIVKFVH